MAKAQINGVSRRIREQFVNSDIVSGMPSNNPRAVGLLAALSIILLAYLALQVPLFADKMAATAPLLAPLSRLLPRASSTFKSTRTFPSAATTSLNRLSPSISQFHLSTSRLFNSTTSANMPSGYDKTPFSEAVKHRRTIYQLNKKAPIDDKRIEEICRQAIKDVPSSFNSQSARLVVLLKDDHDKFWDIVKDILKVHVPEDKWEHTGQRIQGFRNGYGTVSRTYDDSSIYRDLARLLTKLFSQILFYEDPAPIKKLQSTFAQYADKFPSWSEHTSAMHQYELWTALETEGFGCNLQHYNPLPDQKAAAEWNIPLEWSLKAQLVFGGEESGARENLNTKSEEPIEQRLFIHGA